MMIKRLCGLGLLAATMGNMSVPTEAAPKVYATDARTPSEVTYGLENPEVRRGYEAILSAIALVPSRTGKRAQYQAQIAYALDQTQLDCPTTLAALELASRQSGLTPATYGAIRDVTNAAARCSGNGIAALEGGPAGLLNSGPGVGFGGGSSNYTGR